MEASSGLKLYYDGACHHFLACLFGASLQSRVPPWLVWPKAAACLCLYLRSISQRTETFKGEHFYCQLLFLDACSTLSLMEPACHRVIWRILQNDHLVLFTQPETHSLTFTASRTHKHMTVKLWGPYLASSVCQREGGDGGPADLPCPT